MEQKKTLWIIAAAGAFLLVVLGVPAIIYNPSRNPTPAYTSISPVEKRNTNSGWTNSAEQVPVAPPQAEKVSDLVVLADNATVLSKSPITTAETDSATNSGTTIDLNALKSELTNEVSKPQNINITVNIPETNSATVKKSTETSENNKAIKGTKDVYVKSEPVKVQKAETKSTAKTATKNPAVKSASPDTTKTSEKKITQFWVQVAAYSNKKGAEAARSALDANKIPSDIFTYRDNKDKLFYRVRVGPYTTKSEAEYWRTRIYAISEFAKAESYITSTVK